MPRLTRSLLAVVPLLIAVWPAPPATAHDLWISRNGLKNAAGEWCCGAGDCFVVPPTNVSMNGSGYQLFGKEMVPFSEAQPSPDGAFWRCHRPDGTRRCFFAPPPGS